MCKRALAQDPDNVDVLSLYARLVLDMQGDYDEAEKILTGAQILTITLFRVFA